MPGAEPQPADAAPHRGIVGRFLRALCRAETYRPDRNLYTLFGLLWGLPVPFFALALDHISRGAAPTFGSVAACLDERPVHWLFLAHPVLFAVVFGAMGTLAADHERRIGQLVKRLRSLAETDGLTGLFNHRAFEERVRQEAERALREGQPVSLALFDLDHFKELNDLHGHLVGDEVLRRVAAAIALNVRTYDSACRYGGEEFAVILPGMGEKEASEAAGRLRAAVARADLGIPEEPGRRITLSGGVAEWRSGEPVDGWIARADSRLYAAKRQGRNRIVAAGES